MPDNYKKPQSQIPHYQQRNARAAAPAHEHVGTKSRAKREEALSWFGIGVSTHRAAQNNEASIRGIARELQKKDPECSYNSVYRAYLVAKHFDNDHRAFLQHYDQFATPRGVRKTWWAVTKEIVKDTLHATERTKPTKAVLATIIELIEKLLDDRRVPELALKAESTLEAVRKYLQAHLPPDYVLDNQFFFAFSPCCFCGVEPPATEEGHAVMKYRSKDADIMLPVCEECKPEADAGRKEPNYKLAAHIYFYYSQQCELDIDHLRTSLDY